ncbi:hypothetical protein G3N57_00780 [Paraburkholderia sp. Se-20369]|nr:hypothetical protein [Paraburkholderia sp. Se-20369]
MSRKSHIWIEVAATDYVVKVAGRVMARRPNYRECLLFVAGWIGKTVDWVDAEETRVRAGTLAISRVRYAA